MVTSALLVLAVASPAWDLAFQEVTHSLVLAAEVALHRGPYSTAAADADEAKVREAFVPQCTDKLLEISDRWDATSPGAQEHALGHSLATHMQVQCTHALPMEESECDQLAAELQVTIEAGKPFHAPNATNSSNASFLQVIPDPANVTALSSVEEWCGKLFDSFFQAVLDAEAAEAGEEEAALLASGVALKKHALVRRASAQTKDVWAPMRALLTREARVLLKVAKKRLHQPYGAELHKANEEAKAAKAAVYEGAADADAAKAKEAFIPECASTLQGIADTYLGNGLRGSEMTLGLSMATHLQVQCENGMAISESDCDDMSAKLCHLLDAGNPIVVPVPVNNTNGTNGTNGTDDAPAEAEAAPTEEEAAELMQVVRDQQAGVLRGDAAAAAAKLVGLVHVRNDTNATGPVIMASGEEWCGEFFDLFLNAIIEDVKAQAEAGEGEEAAEGEEAPAEEGFLQKVRRA